MGFCDGRLDKQADKKDGVDNSIPANTFLQDWTISTGKGCKLPEDAKSLLKVAKRHGVRLEIAAPPLDVLLDIPVWDHLGLERRSGN